MYRKVGDGRKDLARAREICQLQYGLCSRQSAAWKLLNKKAREKFMRDSLADVALAKEAVINIPWSMTIRAKTVLVAGQKKAIEIGRQQVVFTNEASKKMDAQISEGKS